MEENVKLSSPWEQIHHAMEAFFKDDADIAVHTIDEETTTMVVGTPNGDKLGALDKVLRKIHEFGNVTLKIELQAEGGVEPTLYESNEDALKALLTGNDLFKEIDDMTDPRTGHEFHFCVFVKKVVQYFDDILSDPTGFRSTLAQDIAMEIFDCGDIMFCTDHTDIDE